jgi:hypothetical protein
MTIFWYLYTLCGREISQSLSGGLRVQETHFEALHLEIGAKEPGEMQAETKQNLEKRTKTPLRKTINEINKEQTDTQRDSGQRRIPIGSLGITPS